MFPTVVAITDDFNRADEGPVTGGSWQPVTVDGEAGELEVKTNKLAPGPTSAPQQHWDEVAGPDVESRVTISNLGSDETLRFYVRLTDAESAAATGYVLDIVMPSFYADITLSYLTAGNILTQIGMTTVVSAVSDGEEFGFEVENVPDGSGGTQAALRIWHWRPVSGWNQIGEAFDALFLTAGTAAIELRNTVRADDWHYGTKVPQVDTPIISRPRLIGQRARGDF